MRNFIVQALGALALITACASGAAAKVSHDLQGDTGLIFIDGEISEADLDDFRTVAIRYRKALVFLDSPGGHLLPAIEIGKIIRISQFDTVVVRDASCASSCALIWLAGQERHVAEGGRVGFHASYRKTNGKLEESGVANALIGNYLARLNYSESAIIFTTSASPSQILWLTEENRNLANISYTFWAEDEAQDNQEYSGAQDSPASVNEAQYPQAPSNPPEHPYQYKLHPDLPASLSQGRSLWYLFDKNGFWIDLSSVKIVKDISAAPAGRQFWVLAYYGKSDKKTDDHYAMVEYFVYCPRESVKIYRWIDYKRDGTRKEAKINAAGLGKTAEPGSLEQALVEQVC